MTATEGTLRPTGSVINAADFHRPALLLTRSAQSGAGFLYTRKAALPEDRIFVCGGSLKSSYNLIAKYLDLRKHFLFERADEF
jgi:hypothetical protein